VLKDNIATGEWQRTQRQETVVVPLPNGSPVPPQPVPGSDGLNIVTSIRVVREREDLRGIPAGTRAVSVFLVNKREALEGHDDVKDRWFVFQTGLDVECDQPFVPRPNPRGQEDHDPDERIADLGEG